jgi:hypothetical protein
MREKISIMIKIKFAVKIKIEVFNTAILQCKGIIFVYVRYFSAYPINSKWPIIK